MPRDENTYHHEQQSYRHGRTPYDEGDEHRFRRQTPFDDENNVLEQYRMNGRTDSALEEEEIDANDDEEVRVRYDMSGLRDTVDEETEDVIGNPWNPNGHRNNCFQLGIADVTGLPLEDVEARIGSPSAYAQGGIDGRYIPQVAAQFGLRISGSPPPEEYFEDGGRAAVIHENEDESDDEGHVVEVPGHVVGVAGGNDEQNMVFYDYQEYGVGRDATERVRRARGAGGDDQQILFDDDQEDDIAEEEYEIEKRPRKAYMWKPENRFPDYDKEDDEVPERYEYEEDFDEGNDYIEVDED